MPVQADLPGAELQRVPRAGGLGVCERISSAVKYGDMEHTYPNRFLSELRKTCSLLMSWSSVLWPLRMTFAGSRKAMPLRMGVDLRTIWKDHVGGHAVKLGGDTPCTRGVSRPAPTEGGI